MGVLKRLLHATEEGGRFGSGIELIVLRATCAACLSRAAAHSADHGIGRIERGMTDNAWAYRCSLPGIGLRLAIVAEAASQHRGAAWGADAPFGGARFNLSLPRVEQ